MRSKEIVEKYYFDFSEYAQNENGALMHTMKLIYQSKEQDIICKANYCAGLLYFYNGNYQLAYEHFKNAIFPKDREESPLIDDVLFWVRWAQTCCKLERLDEAQVYFKCASRSSTCKDAYRYAYRGYAFMKINLEGLNKIVNPKELHIQKFLENEIKEFERMFSTDSTDPAETKRLCLLGKAQRDFVQALAIGSKYSLSPEDDQTLSNLCDGFLLNKKAHQDWQSKELDNEPCNTFYRGTDSLQIGETSAVSAISGMKFF